MVWSKTLRPWLDYFLRGRGLEKDVGDGVGIGLWAETVWVPQDTQGGGPPTLGGWMLARAPPSHTRGGHQRKAGPGGLQGRCCSSPSRGVWRRSLSRRCSSSAPTTASRRCHCRGGLWESRSKPEGGRFSGCVVAAPASGVIKSLTFSMVFSLSL